MLGATSIVKISEVWLSSEIGGGFEISKKKLYRDVLFEFHFKFWNTASNGIPVRSLLYGRQTSIRSGCSHYRRYQCVHNHFLSGRKLLQQFVVVVSLQVLLALQHNNKLFYFIF